MTQTPKIQGKSRTRAALLLALPLAVAAPFLFSTAPVATPEVPQTAGAGQEETPLTFFHAEEKYGQANPAAGLMMPYLLDPDAKIHLRSTRTLGKGDTLMNLLLDAGVDRRDAYRAIEALGRNLDPRKVQRGQVVEITIEKPLYQGNTPGRLSTLRLPLAFGEDLTVALNAEGGYVSTLEAVPTTNLRMYAEGVIDDSLYLSALKEGVPLGVVSDMIRLFSFDVDFQREIWSGDKFAIYYERRLTADGEAENTGKILAASLILRGKPLTFYRFEGEGGKADYYTADGKSARKMLMKTPIDGARLTSRYGNRKHPVLGYTRMHKGVDFGAVTGTPIMAAGDGVVERASPWGSYGNYLRIRHNGTYSTAYAHLSAYAKGIKAGARVKQGQIVGYVGATGRVTAAHLHYEILVNGQQANPLTLKMPNGEDLKTSEISLFSNEIAAFESEKTSILTFYAPSPVRLAAAAANGGTRD